MTLSANTLKFKTKKSNRTFCAHCKKDQKHRCCFDPFIKKWIEICLKCEMVELSDNELTKQGTTYRKVVKLDGR